MNHNIIKYFSLKPKILFLIDSLGALATTFFLFIVLRIFNEYFGMPNSILIYLSLITAILCIYSITCFFLLKNNWQPFLKAICIANFLYCYLTLVLVIQFYKKLTVLGMTYFLVEIMIVLGLALLELKTIKKAKKEIN
jgi:hypothetical protein